MKNNVIRKIVILSPPMFHRAIFWYCCCTNFDYEQKQILISMLRNILHVFDHFMQHFKTDFFLSMHLQGFFYISARTTEKTMQQIHDIACFVKSCTKCCNLLTVIARTTFVICFYICCRKLRYLLIVAFLKFFFRPNLMKA